MRYLIIPDIHDKIALADRILDKEEASSDRVVFLGDYFDSYQTGVKEAELTARWLKASLRNKKRVHLIGNHDAAYWSRGAYECSGYTQDKMEAIWSVMTDADWRKLLLRYDLSHHYLCSHAGLDDSLYGIPPFSSKRWVDAARVLAFDWRRAQGWLSGLDRNKPYNSHLALQISRWRGGEDDEGGPLWQDWIDLKVRRDAPQIVGHTQGRKVRRRNNSVCLDTNLQHYATVTNGVLKIHASPKAKGK